MLVNGRQFSMARAMSKSYRRFNGSLFDLSSLERKGGWGLGSTVNDLVLLAGWGALAQQIPVLLVVDLQHAGLRSGTHSFTMGEENTNRGILRKTLRNLVRKGLS